ncbi:MAG TPA: benzoate/H(+) symporter BenE family transporter [Arenicellales bacterium]|nr:benzoate/H(+) symporter BenE family transporter [Arenicellales bacterium]
MSGTGIRASGRRLTADLRRDVSLSAVTAGFLAVLVSYSGPLAILLQAGDSAGIDDRMMASWLWAVSLGAGISGVVLSLWLRVPVVTAWSAPGAALMVALFPNLPLGEAVGAYIVAALALIAIGVSGSFDTLVRRIPQGVAAGMLAGILFNFSVDAFRTLGDAPVLAGGMLATYLVFRRLMPRFVLVVLLLAGVVLAVALQDASVSGVSWSVAQPSAIAPEWSMHSILSVSLPLLLVTLTGQFLPGMAILHAEGYRAPSRPVIGTIGLVSVPAAVFGGVTVCLAAITAALCTGGNAHENPDRRYIAGVASGSFYLLGGIFAGGIVSLFASLPTAFVTVLAGLALVGAISGNLASAVAERRHREAAVITFIATASNVSLMGLSSAFWGIVIGLAAYLVLDDPD